MTMLRSFTNVTVIGKRWFDKINGNTYHSVVVLLDSVEEVRVPFAYGYDDSYLQTAMSELVKKDLPNVVHYKQGGTESLRSWCGKHGIPFYASVSDVARKKDL